MHRSVSSGFGRRIAWILYGLIFIFIWGTRPAGQLSSAANWLYIAGFLASAVSFFLDKTLHGYFNLSDIKKFERGSKNKKIANLKDELGRLINSSGYPEDKDIKKRVDTIRKKLIKLGASPDAMY